VRSRISSCSNSARAAKMSKTRRKLCSKLLDNLLVWIIL
jgi:hypothetical protein